VSHKQDRFPVFLPDAQQFVLEQQAILLIEIGERLVHEQDRGIGRQRPGDVYPLAHSLRELMRVGVAERQQAHLSEMLSRALAPLPRRHAHQAQAVGHIVQRSHPRQGAGPLENEGGPEAAGVAPGQTD